MTRAIIFTFYALDLKPCLIKEKTMSYIREPDKNYRIEHDNSNKIQTAFPPLEIHLINKSANALALCHPPSASFCSVLAGQWSSRIFTAL